MRKSGFTAVEFIICLTFMMLIFGGMISISFKKAKTTMPTQKLTNIYRCSCSDSEYVSQGYCLRTFDNNSGRDEFFTIQILGAGAAGSPYKSGQIGKGGSSGEGKIIHYPTLSGTFLIKLGEGGKADGSGNINGGATVIYKLNEETKVFEVFEFALGGVGANENINEDTEIHEIDPDKKEMEIAQLQNGKIPTFGTDDIITSCGAGGKGGSSTDGAQDGKGGEVVIKW